MIDKKNIEELMICARGFTYELETLFRRIELGQEVDYRFRLLNLNNMYYRRLSSGFNEILEKELKNEKK